MAKKLGKFDFRSNKIYPWNEWTDGSIWEVKRGDDFHCEVKSFVTTLHDHAKAMGTKVHTSKKGDTVTFQFQTKKKRKAS